MNHNNVNVHGIGQTFNVTTHFYYHCPTDKITRFANHRIETNHHADLHTTLSIVYR